MDVMDDYLDEDPGALPTDAVVVRNLTNDDLAAIVRIDRQSVGRERTEYYRAKIRAALDGAKLQTSVVGILDDHVVGFVLATLHYGEFGRTEPVCVLDSIGVDPAYRGRHVGQALMRQLLMNLRALNVEHVETQVDWAHFDLLSFLRAQGFEPAPRLTLRLALSGE